MGTRGSRLVLLALCAVALGACGKEIGDACTLSSDCSPNGDRVCACSNCSDSSGQASDQSFCTVLGCDHSTCPDEAACFRFFTGDFDNRVCDSMAAPDSCTATASTVCCSLDELCAINGHCVPRSSEIRYCMRKCDSDGDCRDGFECRDFALAQQHGGQVVLAPPPPGGSYVPVSAQNSPKFCAAKPST